MHCGTWPTMGRFHVTPSRHPWSHKARQSPQRSCEKPAGPGGAKNFCRAAPCGVLSLHTSTVRLSLKFRKYRPSNGLLRAVSELPRLPWPVPPPKRPMLMPATGAGSELIASRPSPTAGFKPPRTATTHATTAPQTNARPPISTEMAARGLQCAA